MRIVVNVITGNTIPNPMMKLLFAIQAFSSRLSRMAAATRPATSPTMSVPPMKNGHVSLSIVSAWDP